MSQQKQRIGGYLPEDLEYRDTGCSLAGSCLECPFPECIDGAPGGKRHYLKQQRNSEISRLYDTGKTSKDLSVLFNISRKTIQRAIR